MATTRELIARVRAEYLEMPGMRLTIQQMQRLFGIEQTPCQAVLDSLVEARFLCMKPGGSYARQTDRDVPRPRPARAYLGIERRVAVH